MNHLRRFSFFLALSLLLSCVACSSSSEEDVTTSCAPVSTVTDAASEEIVSEADLSGSSVKDESLSVSDALEPSAGATESEEADNKSEEARSSSSVKDAAASLAASIKATESTQSKSETSTSATSKSEISTSATSKSEASTSATSKSEISTSASSSSKADTPSSSASKTDDEEAVTSSCAAAEPADDGFVYSSVDHNRAYLASSEYALVQSLDDEAMPIEFGKQDYSDAKYYYAPVNMSPSRFMMNHGYELWGVKCRCCDYKIKLDKTDWNLQAMYTEWYAHLKECHPGVSLNNIDDWKIYRKEYDEDTWRYYDLYKDLIPLYYANGKAIYDNKGNKIQY